MKIAVMSDTHDNIWNVRKALSLVRSSGAGAVIHCGDIIAPFVFKEFAEAAIPLHCVFGNNDGDKYLLTKTAFSSNGLITLYGNLGQISMGGISIAFTHEPEFAEALAATGRYELVCYGHTHVPEQKKTGNAVLLNPGDVMGKEDDPGICIVDTKKITVSRLALN
ncbi:MAG: metallophosphoesterase [Desulfosalsimonas sp.]